MTDKPEFLITTEARSKACEALLDAGGELVVDVVEEVIRAALGGEYSVVFEYPTLSRVPDGMVVN